MRLKIEVSGEGITGTADMQCMNSFCRSANWDRVEENVYKCKGCGCLMSVSPSVRIKAVDEDPFSEEE
jgi:hypothetical protein